MASQNSDGHLAEQGFSSKLTRLGNPLHLTLSSEEHGKYWLYPRKWLFWTMLIVSTLNISYTLFSHLGRFSWFWILFPLPVFQQKEWARGKGNRAWHPRTQMGKEHHLVEVCDGASENWDPGVGVSDSLWSHGLYPSRLLCPWDSPGKNTGVCCHSLLQGIFPTQGSNLGLPHCRQILYWLGHQGWGYQS